MVMNEQHKTIIDSSSRATCFTRFSMSPYKRAIQKAHTKTSPLKGLQITQNKSITLHHWRHVTWPLNISCWHLLSDDLHNNFSAFPSSLPYDLLCFTLVYNWTHKLITKEACLVWTFSFAPFILSGNSSLAVHPYKAYKVF